MTFLRNETAKRRLLWAAAMFFLVLLLVYRLVIAFSYKQELTNGESNNLWNAMNAAHGKALYSDPEELPLEVFQYTPLSQLPVILFASIFDSESPNYLYHISLFGRLAALCYNLLTGYIIYVLLIRIYVADRLTAFLGSLLFFSTLTHPNFAIRPDALLLITVMLLALGFIQALLKEQWKALYLLSFLVGLAMLVKQDAFFVMGPVGFFLLVYRKWKAFLLSSFFFLAGVVFFFSLAHIVFGPHFFYSVTKGIQMKSSASQAILVFDRAISLFGLPFILSLLIAGYIVFFERTDRKMVLLSLFTAGYAVLGFASSFKPGSWVNYYTFFILFGSVLSVVFFQGLFKESRFPYFITLFVLLVGGIFWFRQVYFYTLPYLKGTEAKKEYEATYIVSEKIKKELNLTGDDNIFVANQLIRTFLFTHSVLVNTEYYGVSNFNYEKFKAKENKNIRYIIASEEEIGGIDFLYNTFNLGLDSFKPIIQIDKFIIYKKDG